MKDLMVHVERIVRPVPASGRRKLRMRRELLEHLEAAVQEERIKGGSEDEVLERARRRLGDPAKMTQQLRQSVPWVERIIRTKLPAPRLIERWEARSEKEWGYLTMALGAVVSGAAIVVALMAMGLATPIPEDRRNLFFAMQTEDPARYLAICIAGGVIAAALPLMVISLMGKALNGKWRSRGVLVRSAIIVVLKVMWVLLVNSQVVGLLVGVSDVLRGLAAGIIMVAVQIAVARAIVRMGDHSREWRLLDIAES